MTDIRKICKIFLEFVYDNNILPTKIVDILKHTDNGENTWDFRLICKLLRFKENYKSNNIKISHTEKILNNNAHLLQDINIWRDNISIRHLDNLWRAANDFFHNVSAEDPVFKPTLIALIQTANQNDVYEIINKIQNDTQPVHIVTKPIVKPVKSVNPNDENTGKAIERIPKWALHPTQFNHIIVWSFLKAASIDGEERVTLDFMRNLCKHQGMSDKQFRINYASMKTDKHNSHGKVFEEIGPYVRLWDRVKHVVMEYKKYFLPEE